MSTEESTSGLQSPTAEALDRAAESFPAFLMPRLVGVDHLMRTLSSARRRVNDSHKLQMFKLKETIGYEESKPETDEEDMGGISVAGDTHINITSPAEKPTMAESAAKVKSWWPAIAVGAALLGPAAGFLLSQWTKPQPAPQQPAATDTDTDTVMVIDFPTE